MLTGPPGGVTGINISSNTITACSLVVQWSKASSDPVCGSVWYTVTISTGGMVIITDNTTLTNYTITGLNDNTTYHVSVTANNNAGSSNATSVITMTNNNIKFISTVEIDKIPFVYATLLSYTLYCLYNMRPIHFTKCDQIYQKIPSLHTISMFTFHCHLMDAAID